MSEFDNDGIKRESKWDRIRAHEPSEKTEQPLPEGIVARSSDVFTEQALRAQDGQRVPLRLENGGPVVGEAVLKYDPDEKALMAQLQVDDPKVAAFLKGTMPSIFSEGE